MRPFIVGFILIGFLVLIPLVSFSQPGGGGPGGGGPPVPITGIEVLLAIGGALGIRKLIAERRSKNH